MEAVYHVQVLERSIGKQVSRRALASITAANLNQDSLRGLLQPEFHFDNNLFAQSLAYMETLRAQAASGPAPAAWAAFGRLTHTAQDFYSHSNYVALWIEQFAASGQPPLAAIDGLDPRLLHHPRLITAHVYLPLEALCLFPALRRFVKPLLPHNSHAWMNLDAPDTGPLFPHSLEAAVQRTRAEFERTLAAIGEAQDEAAMAAFLDLGRA